MKLGYLGPRTNSEIVAKKLGRGFEHVVLDSVERVIESLDEGKVDLAVVPVRNSITGDMEEHLKEIKKREFKVVEEVSVLIKHCFAVTRKDVGFIISHEQALKQCQAYLEREYPKVYREAVRSTEWAARFVSEIGHGAAIAPLETCKYYGLIIRDRDIVKDNYSLFYICKK